MHASAPVGMEADTNGSRRRFGRMERRSEMTTERAGERTNRRVEMNNNTTQEVLRPTRNDGRTRSRDGRSINWIESERVGAYARLLGELYAFVRVELRDGRMFDDNVRLFVVCEARQAHTLAERRWELFVDEVLDVVAPRFRVIEFLIMDEGIEEEGEVEQETEQEVEGNVQGEIERENEEEMESNEEQALEVEESETGQGDVSIRVDEVMVVVEAQPIVEVAEGEMIVEGVLVAEAERFSSSSFFPSLSRRPQSSLLPNSTFESSSIAFIRQLMRPWFPPKLPEVVKRHLARVAPTQHLQVCII